MKKKIALLFVSIMMFAGVGSAFAASTTADSTQSETVVQDIGSTPAKVKKMDLLKEFQDELHQINALRVERLTLKTKIIQKQDHIIDLTLAAKERGDKEAVQAAAGIKKQIHSVNQELDSLWNGMRDEVKAFRQALKDRSKEQAQSHMNQAISLFGQMNVKLGQKAVLLDQVVIALK
jgi:hypothetical protein